MLAVLDNNDRLQCLTDEYFDSCLHTFLQGTAAFFTCSVLQTSEIAQYFKVGNKLSFVSNDVNYHFDITKMNKNEQLVTIQADSLTLELRNEFASEYKASKAMTFKQYLDVFLFAGDNPLVMGINEVSDKSLQAEWTGDGESILARLFSLANKFDAEIEFETVLNKHWGLDKVRLNVYRAHSDKYQGIGKKRTDIIMEYGNNVETIEYEENIDDLKTAILPIGTDGLLIGNVVIDEKDKNGNQLFLSIKTDNYIRAVQSRDRFRSKMGSFDGYIAKRWTYETTNANVLAGQALAELKKLCEPKVTVTIKGYEYLGIGDTVLVQNTAYVPMLNLSARISEQEIYFDDPSKNTSTFTNVEILQSEVDQSLLDRVNVLIERTKPYTLSLVSDNGVTFKNSEGSTTLSAIVYNGTQVITPDVTVRWYKDDMWVKTGYSLEVKASDINDKAVYKAIVIDTNGKERATQDVTVFNVDDGKLSDLTDDEKKEIASHGEQFIAYAWKEDGTDRFTRDYPSENIVLKTDKPVYITSTTTDTMDVRDLFPINPSFKSISNWLEPSEEFAIGLKWTSSTSLSNAALGVFFNNRPWISGFADVQDVSGTSGTLFKTGVGYDGFRATTQDLMTIRLVGVPVGTKITITDLFVTKGKINLYRPSPVTDYDNAVPRYIGRSLKDSNSPSDYKWEPNPDRKPWVAYAQDVNGKDFSLMPYGEQLLPNTSTDMTIASNSSSDNYRHNVLPVVLQPYTSYTFSSDVILTGSGNGEPNKVSVLVYTPDAVNRINGTNDFIANNGRFSWSFTTDSREARLLIYAGQQAKTGGYKAVYRKSKLEPANTMNIPTPWTPAPSEDPLGAIPKYVGTAALPYEDWTKYTWDLNPAWLQQESNNNLANKVDNDTYNNDQSNVWTEISNRVTEEEAQAIQKSLDRITGAYTDFVSTGGKHDQDLANLKSAINTDIQKLADKVLGYDFVNTWFRIGDGGLSIGEANSNFELLISNDQITFYDSGTAVAYVSNQSFFINSGMIVDDLQIGKFKFAKVNDNLMGLFHIA